MAKPKNVWICWQEPESERGKFSYVPTSMVARTIAGDLTTPLSTILCRWPRTDELFTAKIVQEPSPADLVISGLLPITTAMDASKCGGHSSHSTGDNSTNSLMPQIRKFFLAEMGKMCAEIQANFDILGHRIGALEVNVKCIRERVERVENLLNTAVQDLDAERAQQQQQQQQLEEHMDGDDAGNDEMESKNYVFGQPVPVNEMSQARQPVANSRKRPPQTTSVSEHDLKKAVVIPRSNEQRVRKDRNPRPRAVVITHPRDVNTVFLGGDERYRMKLPAYLDAIRHAKRPTATYMVTALLRRYLPGSTLSRLCVNERQLANTAGGHMIDEELLVALKKQGCMQFPNTVINDNDLILRIEDVARDVRRKLKSRRQNVPKRTSTSGPTPISMVTSNRPSFVVNDSVLNTSMYNDFNTNEDHDIDDGGQFQQNQSDDGDDVGNNVDRLGAMNDDPEALPMFS